jgi:short-subunit dehydrogenase
MYPQSTAKFSLALVTGATSGIGEGLAHFLADKGIPLFLTGRNAQKLQEMKNILSQKVPVEILSVDLIKNEERKQLVNKIKELSPDLVINNAGMSIYGEILKSETQDVLNIIELNINALVELTLASARSLVSKKKEGVILNVSSAASFFSMPGFATYAASKAFVTSFSEALNYEFEQYGIHVLAACPGVVETNFRERSGGLEDPQESVMSVDFAVKEIFKQIESQKPVYVFGFRYRVLGFFSKYFSPRSLVNKIIYSRMKKISPNKDLIL